jgi:prenyltransferase beta subunit
MERARKPACLPANFQEKRRQVSRGGNMRIVIRYLRALWISALFCALIAPSLVRAQTSNTKPSLDYLVQHQDAITGGLFEEGSLTPALLPTSWGAIAFAAAGYDPGSVGKISLNDYIAQNACRLTSITDIERAILAITASDKNPHNFNGCDITAKLESGIDNSSGLIGTDIISTIFGILAIRSYDGLIPDQTINYMVSQQQADGGWDSGWGTESNITAQAVMALISADYDKQSVAMVNAKQYLKNLQTDTGGIKYDANAWTTAPDAFSDAYTLQAIYALGENPTDIFWQTEGKTILDDIVTLRQLDGSYNFSTLWGVMNPVWTTAVVIPALEGKPLGWHGKDLATYGADTPPIPPAPNTPTITHETEVVTPVSNQKLAPQTDTERALPTDDDTDIIVSLLVRETLPSVSDDAQIISRDNSAIKGAISEIPHTPKPPRNIPLLIILTTSGLLVGAAISIVGRRYSKILILILLFSAMLILPSVAQAARAGIVVRHSNSEIRQTCVNFSEPTISGLELLYRAGMNPVLDNGFIVELDGERAKSFNEPGASDDYWSYWNLANSQWQYARLGATYNQIHDGEIDGWQRGNSTLLLALVSFEQICPTTEATTVDNTSSIPTASAPEDTNPTLLAEDTPIASTDSAKRAADTLSPPPTQTASVAQNATADPGRVAGANDNTTQSTNYTIVILVTAISIFAGFFTTRELTKLKHKK